MAAKRTSTGQVLAWAGAALGLATGVPAGQAAGETGGPGDPVAEFRMRDAWLKPNSASSAAGVVRAVARRLEGGWLIGGAISGAGDGGQPAGLWRLDAAGQILAPGQDALTLGSVVTALHVMPDGRVLLGGGMRLNPEFHSPRGRSLLRLLPGGRVDPAFTGAGGLSFTGSILALAVDREGRVLVGGDFQFVRTTNQSLPASGILRLNGDGSPDPAWRSPLADGPAVVRRIIAAADGGFWVAGDFSGPGGRRHLIRLTTDGLLDESFDASRSVVRPVHDVAETGDGTLWVADGELGRVLPDGSGDPGFPGRLPVPGLLGARVLLPEGDAVWIGGRFGRVGGLSRTNLALVDRHGRVASNTPPASLTAYLDDPPAEIHALAHGEDGTLVVGGSFRRLNGVGRPGIAWLARDGTVEVERLRSGLLDQTSLGGLAAAPEGGIVVSGFSLDCHGWRRFGVMRLRPDGGVDRSFDSALGLLQDSSQAIQHAVVEPDGAIVATGTPALQGGSYTLLRLRPDGSLDPGFGPDGRVASLPGTTADLSALLRLPDGGLLVAGRLTQWGLPATNGLYRLLADGRPAPGFQVQLPRPAQGIPEYPIGSLAVEADGRILVGGAGLLARLEPDGRLSADLARTNPALQQRQINRLMPRRDGRLLAESFHLARRSVETRQLLADGRADPDFLAQPLRLFGTWPDDRLLLGSEAGRSPARLERAFPNGRLDGSFSVTITNATLRLATLLADGSVAAVLHADHPWPRGNELELIRLRGDAPSLSRFRIESRGGVSLAVSGPPGAEMRVEVSPDWQTWTEVARGRLPATGHVRWHVGPAAVPGGPSAFFRTRPAAP